MKKRKLEGTFEVLSNPVTDLHESEFNKDNSIKRAVSEPGWKCPYCGLKFKNYSYFSEFTLEDHLQQTIECRKEHERNK